jgi:hypothetical protein
MGRWQSVLANYYENEYYNDGRREIFDVLSKEYPDIALEYVSPPSQEPEEKKVILGVVKLYEEGVPESHALPIIMRILGAIQNPNNKYSTDKDQLQNIVNELRNSGHLYSFEDMKREYKRSWLKITSLGEQYLNECDET